jgi:hypothetical protein
VSDIFDITRDSIYLLCATWQISLLLLAFCAIALVRTIQSGVRLDRNYLILALPALGILFYPILGSIGEGTQNSLPIHILWGAQVIIVALLIWAFKRARMFVISVGLWILWLSFCFHGLAQMAIRDI